jgi:hypothetical protein
MFEVNRSYANRKGTYTVLAIDPPKMTVRYDDGTTAELNMEIQGRIWENMQSEEEARAASRMARQRKTGQENKFFIKSLSLVTEEDLSGPGWRDRLGAVEAGGPEFEAGDRIIYFAIENQVFFAVATVTGPALETAPKDLFYVEDDVESMTFYPVDIDEHMYNLGNAVELDSVELESAPQYRRLLQKPNTYFSVGEDDFELLAELLTEISEEEEEEFEDEEEEEEFED